MLAQYLNTVETKNLSFEAFGGRWGISECELVPMDLIYTRIWIYGKVAELNVPMLAVLIFAGLSVVVAIGGWSLLARRRRRGE